MTDRTPGQDAHMRHLITHLNLLSHVAAANPNADGSAATDEHPGGRPPTGGGRNGHDWWTRYLGATDPDMVIAEAEGELEHAHRSGGDRDTTETAEQLTARIRRLRTDGWTIREVSLHCRCTETRVRQADRDTTVTRVLELHGRCTVRQIETITGIPKSTVQRIIEAEAA